MDSKAAAKLNPDETADIQQSLQGDAEAYRRLVDRHQDHVARIMWRFSRDRGTHEELVQDVFVEAYLSLKNYRGRAPWSHWLARVATHIGYHYWRREKQRRSREQFDFQHWDALVDGSQLDEIDNEQAAELLYRLLEQLPPRDRLVLTLRYLEQCDVEETAQRTGWSESMVKVQSHRARGKLKKLFAQAGKDIEL